jgi:hypothetical protein
MDYWARDGSPIPPIPPMQYTGDVVSCQELAGTGIVTFSKPDLTLSPRITLNRLLWPLPECISR